MELKKSLVVVLLLLGGITAVWLAWNLAAGGGEAVVINGTAVPPIPALDPEQVADGQTVYAAHCAECHGENLEGAANWKQPLEDGSLPAPPHDSSGHTWHHADQAIREIIEAGGNPELGGTMPSFGQVLSEQEVEAVMAFIKSQWEQEQREFQWWITVTYAP